MTDPTRAVFLSYATQDAEAARRISEALRAGGIEVWFDQSELRGGDAWDRQIRKQIHDCSLFIPIISANTQARLEGYFRLEWKLAVERTHLMSDRVAFLVPVVIDDTVDAQADVPEAFRAMQWTRVPAGQTPPAFVARIAQLLSPSEPQSAQARLSTGSAPPAHPSTPGAAASWRSKLVPLLFAVIGLLGVGYFAVDKFALSKRALNAAPDSGTTLLPGAPAPSAIPDKSVAVLPFADMSEKKDQEYFSDGLTEELIDLLSQVQDLRVPARTSSFYFKGKQATIAEIAKALGVANVLEGSVRKAGNTLRVTVQLIRADTGYHLWSQTYDGNTKDIFEVQDAVAAAVVEVLKAKLAPAQPVAPSRSANLEAYNHYLLGRQFLIRQNLDNNRRAAEAYGKAIALDPNYAAAYAGLAYAQYHVADWAGDAAGLKRAQEAAERAVALAPGEADGYGTRGFLRSYISWDWIGAQADLAKALAINPADSLVQLDYAELLADLGRLPEAIAAARRAIEFDPLSSLAWNDLGYYLMATPDYPAAGKALHRALEIQPDSEQALFDLGLAQLLGGQAAQALATFRKIGERAFRLTGVAMAEYTLGRAQESQQALDELIATEAQGVAYQIAEAFAWRGEKDQAFAWLNRAHRQRDGGLPRAKIDPRIASLRDDPRYTALLRSLNLPE